MISYPELEQKAQSEVETIIATHPRAWLTYHNIQHIQRVVTMADQLSQTYQYDDRRRYLLRIAGWFHDIGYFTGPCDGHEKNSAETAADFLQKNEVPEADIDVVKSCILATQMPQQPVSEEQKIICDADLSHLASPDFYENTKNLRKEMEKVKNVKIGKKEWLASTLVFLQKHRYFTDYGKNVMEKEKQKNIELIQSKLAEDNNPDEDKVKDKKKSKEEEKPSKGVETMFRITSNNNQKLSQMADNKAHILISVNSIILSAIISLLLRKLGEYEYLSIPTYIILSVSVLSMIFSLLATRPNLPSGQFSKSELDDKKVNLLFFGNFYQMSLDEYTDGMLSVMKDYDYLYRSLIKDVYSQGVVLSKKYKLLRISYNVFMFGMILSVIAFILASIFFKPIS